MPKLAPISDAGKIPACPRCGVQVIPVAGGRLVEQCGAGTGNVALLPDLFGGPLVASRLGRSLKSSFRFHRCAMTAGGSFTADGRQRKQRPSEAPAVRRSGGGS
jgi:hypothetical protein